MTFQDHFSTIAARYAAHRPHYPQALTDALAERCADRSTAWDAGCGTGHLSIQLATRFGQVIATDPAQALLDAAPRHLRVEYRLARAEDPVLSDASVDLAVAAQAAHWFDWRRYVAQVDRVTRPGAVVGLVCYGLMHVDGAADLVTRYYHEDAGPYWPAGREHIENGYRDLVWPWPAIDAPALDMIATWTRDELVGYLATWSATVRLVNAQGPAAFDRLRENLAHIWPDDERRTVTWPLTIRLARR